MSRFFVPKESIKGNIISIGGKEAHHILDVMRLKELDKVVAFDGTGREYTGFIKDAGSKALTIEIVETKTPLDRESSRITLIQAIPKKERMDYIVEKATELGACAVVPLVTKRTIVRWDERKSAQNVERWMRIAREASKQCGRTSLPAIGRVKTFTDAIKDLNNYDISLMATLNEGAVKLKDILRGFRGGKISVWIGPEGDFTPDESKKAVLAGINLAGLGARVLKSDTAGLAALAILNYEFSN